MSNDWQTPLALLAVFLATVYLVRVAINKRRHPGCGSNGEGCGCDQIKKKLGR